jgi:hypothetical protein
MVCSPPASYYLWASEGIAEFGMLYMWRMVMVPLCAGRSWLAYPIVLALLVSSVCSVSAQDEAQAKQRLELMQAAVGSLELETTESKPKAALTFASKPLLRYSDPTRGGINEAAVNVLLDASVWRLGTEGRPTALVTVEIYQAPDTSRILAFEFLSLSERKFTLKHKTQNIHWEPASSALAMKELPDAPKPAASATARLVQMRKLARRFATKERIKNESIECRLLTQPIDRYQSAAEKVVDGAIFAFANSTNPEIGLVFESDGERWLYGILRLTSAEASVTLDDRQVAAFDHFDARRHTDGPYHSASHKIEIDK